MSLITVLHPTADCRAPVDLAEHCYNVGGIPVPTSADHYTVIDDIVPDEGATYLDSPTETSGMELFMFGHDPKYTDTNSPIDHLQLVTRYKSTEGWSAEWAFRAWIVYVPLGGAEEDVRWEWSDTCTNGIFNPLTWYEVSASTNMANNFVTGLPWKWEDFDSFAFGIQKGLGSVNNLQFTQLRLRVYNGLVESGSNAVWYFGI